MCLPSCGRQACAVSLTPRWPALLLQYLDSHEPTNPLGVVMVPVPQTLAERFLGALGRLGAGSARPGRFPQLSLSAFADGSGRLPGKVAGAGSKGFHADFEVRGFTWADAVLQR